MSLIGTLLFSCWVSVTGGGFPLEWFWKLPGKKIRKGKNNQARDRVLSRFWSCWSPCLWCRRETHAAGIASVCGRPDPAKTLHLACARVVGFIAGRSTGTLAPETGLTHGFHAVPQSQGQQPHPRRRYLNSIKQLLSAYVKWAGF